MSAYGVDSEVQGASNHPRVNLEVFYGHSLYQERRL